MSQLPTTMIAIEIDGFGGPDVLKPTARSMPMPGAGEVLIAVAAAGINRPDIHQREGNYAPPPGASDIPGLEVAGTIVAVGLGVHHLAVGQEVCALVAGGGYATYCVAPAPQVLPVPKGLSLVEAAALPETFFTVWTNLFERGALKPGESVLVHGGSSGIGTTAIQLAKQFGARIFVTAGSIEKCQACEKLGADVAIEYKREDFAQVIKAKTTGRGVDVILDMIGGDYFQRNINSLAMDGRLVSIAFLRGARVEINFIPVMRNRLTITGSTLRPRTVEQKGAIAAALREKVWPLIEKGKVKPLIEQTFPLAEAAEAHRLLESSAHIGKIVLTV
ncbi:MAG TPA: NAD(P)H-quinone oxidoreductase [Stellaceae bacterium]|jgi:putative PIG3 family NAD(P)H quinone oxidoreductase|nr:NAD(P)H-quinone oxidoreductase [Stellaceae bacterium]